MENVRQAEVSRNTKETQITLSINLDGKGDGLIDTGIPFFDHMLDAFCRHGLFDIKVDAEGDLEVDYHHLIEDVGIVLGQAFKKAIGDKVGIKRYGHYSLPMDDSLSDCAVDLCNRPYLVYNVKSPTRFIRDLNIDLFKEFFQAFANECGANIHINLRYGQEPHHIIESVFKSFARAMDMACSYEPRIGNGLYTTKGVI